MGRRGRWPVGLHLFETWVRSADGEAIAVSARWGGSGYARGAVFPGGYAGFAPAAPDRRSAGRHLAELKATLESTGDGILVLNKDGAVRHYNRRFLELWGVPESVLDTGRDADLLSHMLANVRRPAGLPKQLEQIAQDPCVREPMCCCCVRGACSNA